MISEEFDNPVGQYRFYDAEPITQLDELVARRHKDIRSFYADNVVIRLTMPNIALMMSELNPMTMADLEGNEQFREAESWTNGTSGPDPARQRRNTLRWNLITGAQTTESEAAAVNLTAFSDPDELVASFPNFPGSALNRAASNLQLEDANGNVCTLSFAGATSSNGPQSVSWPMSSVTVTSPTIVRLNMTATEDATLVLSNIRVLDPDWTATKLDMDTITQRLVPTFDRDGNIPFSEFPKLWRSTEPPSDDDPLPVDGRYAVNFYTGNLAWDNRITLFFRGRREDLITQLDLDGSDTTGPDGLPLFGESQQTLESRGHQPDYGIAVYNPRAQMDLDTLDQTALESYLQGSLERVSDTISESWIEVALYFGEQNKVVVGTTETLTDEERSIFPVSGLLQQNNYLFTVDLEAHTLRARIYLLDSSGVITDVDSPVWDSADLSNEFLLKRRKGRVGWKVQLGDGDAYVDSIRSRGLSFGEVITNSFESFTPVEGARLFAGGSGDIRIPAESTSFNGATVTVDQFNSRSEDGSSKIVSPALSGMQTGYIPFDDFEHTYISFDLYYPGAALAQGHALLPALINERNYMVPLVIPTIVADRWQAVTIRPTQAIREQSGPYRFALIQSSGTATWWIDNLSIIQKTVAWAGRASYNDPWNREENRWTEFLGLVNSELDGVMFPERGRWTQIRGRALTQNASIDKVYVKPKYAELGRLVWNED